MSVKVDHRVSHRGDANHNGQNSAGDIAESILLGTGMFDQCSLQQKAGIEIIEIEINDGQPTVVEIIVLSTIVSEMIRCCCPHVAHSCLNFAIQKSCVSSENGPLAR